MRNEEQEGAHHAELGFPFLLGSLGRKTKPGQKAQKKPALR